jgi:HD-GYP domain-containing protein (c-di-GMP phosphodiesterase class II)
MERRLPVTGERIRAAEVIASLCLATDLGMGFPFEHGLQATVTTMRLCDGLGVDRDTATQAYFASLLMHAGCTVDAEVGVGIFHGSITGSGVHRMFGSPLAASAGAVAAIPDPEGRWPTRAYQVAVGLPRAARFRTTHFVAFCEVAERLAQQLGLPASIHRLFSLLTERWDGRSNLRRAQGDEVPLALRITHVARDAAYQRLLDGDAQAVETIRSRAGHAFDPDVVEALVRGAPDILGAAGAVGSVWDDVLAVEPEPRLSLEGASIDRALAAVGAFSDLASPYLSGHAAGVGELAAAGGALAGFDDDEVRDVRRSGYLHDVGRVAVHPRVWLKAGRLTADEWEQVRLHPYHTERVLHRSPCLAPLARAAGAHHERLDASGYHRGIGAAALPPPARLLAAADAFHSKLEPRPYRAAYRPADVAAIVADRARAGKLDPTMSAAVIEAAGQVPHRVEHPAGLTKRELEVVGLLARGQATKQVARRLGISTKTADRHIQNAYRKMGVSSRAAATLFATEHGLVSWGGSPIPGAPGPP